MKESISRCGLVILAAGASSRLGRPKQLLRYKGKTLLQHMIDVAIDADARPIIVVLGAGSDPAVKEIQPVLKEDSPVQIVFNGEWSEGIASSIRSGIRTLQDTDPLAEGVILTVCDQPYITTGLLNSLPAEQARSGAAIVASIYAPVAGNVRAVGNVRIAGSVRVAGGEQADGSQVVGTPVLFHRDFFPELLALKGDAGAKKLIRQYADLVATVPFPGGETDIDTEEDYEALSAGG